MNDREEPLRISGLAVASLVLSVIPTGVGQILSLIFGIVALDHTSGEKPSARGRGLATAGLILTTMWLVAIPLTCVILWFAYPRSNQPDSQKTLPSAQGEQVQKPGTQSEQVQKPSVQGEPVQKASKGSSSATQAETKAAKPRKPQQQGLGKHSVILKVETEPREDKYGFDLSAAVQKKLKAAGIQVFTDENKTADGVVVIQYSEREGAQYATFFGTGAPVGRGTVIVCKFSVLNSSTGEIACEMEISRGTPSQVDSVSGLYSEAVKNFENSEDFTLIAYYVAAALDDKQAMPSIVTRLSNPGTKETVLNLAKACAYEPESPSEKAYFAVALGNLAECEKLGDAAIAPLIAHLDYIRYTDTKDMREAIRILGVLKATEASGRVTGALREYAQGFYGDVDDTDRTSMMVLLINALGNIGDQEALDEISKLVGDERPEVAQAAKDASGKLTARLSPKPAGKQRK